MAGSGVKLGGAGIVGALAFVGLAVAQPPAAEAPSAELREIVRQDQAARQTTLPTTPEAIQKFVAEDKARRKRVAALLQADKLTTGEDFDNAGLVFQHGETPDDFLTAHELSIIAVLKGKKNSLPATAEDRFLEHIGRTQRFGTQFKQNKDGKMALSPISVGKPTDATDALRADMFVPTPAQWRHFRDGRAIEAVLPLILKRFTRGTDAQFIAAAKKRPEAAELRRLAATPKMATKKREAAANRALALYRSDKLATLEDYLNAARAIRFRSEADAALLAHELALVAAFRGDKIAAAFAAESLDAFLIEAGWQPRYATGKQGGKTEKPLLPATDAVKRAFGLSVTPRGAAEK